MEKTKKYNNVKFSVDALKEVYTLFCDFVKDDLDNVYYRLKVDHDDSEWRYDRAEDLNEFYSDYRKYQKDIVFSIGNSKIGVSIYLHMQCYFDSFNTTVSIESKGKPFISSIFEVFDKYKELDYVEPLLPILKKIPKEKPIVFIGHGRSMQWRDLKDHLHDKHDIQIEAYETGARAGHTIRDILDDMAKNSTFALLVMTKEDEQVGGEVRARQNVIHEIGLFQGRLGFNRAIVLMEEGVEKFSNIAGIQQIRYTNIAETFGEVLATIKREFD